MALLPPIASATVLLDNSAASQPAVKAASGMRARVVEAPTKPGVPWSWLIVGALIGFAPLAVERAVRRNSRHRRYSRLDVAVLEAELAELRARAEAKGGMPVAGGLATDHRAEEHFEIRAPVEAIIGVVDSLLEAGLTDVQRAEVDKIRSNAASVLASLGGAPDSVETEAATATAVDATRPRPLRVLLAEDNEVNREVACAHLQRAGHEVDVVDNGAGALAAVQRGAYDIVLMDIRLPDMDGVAAIRAIRALGGDKGKVPIIALTADAMADDREKYLSMGADGYVSNLIESKDLFGAIGACCGTDLGALSAAGILASDDPEAAAGAG